MLHAHVGQVVKGIVRIDPAEDRIVTLVRKRASLLDNLLLECVQHLADQLVSGLGGHRVKQILIADLTVLLEAGLGHLHEQALNIENREANPKMHIMYPLIRKLNIDPVSIFYPERALESPTKRGLHAEVDCLTEEEAAMITPIFRDLIVLVRGTRGVFFGPKESNSSK